MSIVTCLFEKLYSLLKSLRFTAGIIISGCILFLLGLLVPQKALFDSAEQYNSWRDSSALHTILDALRCTDIYTSPQALLLLSLFFINLITVVLSRTPLILRKAYLSGVLPIINPERIKDSQTAHKIITPLPTEELSRQVEQFFRKRRWSFIPCAEAGTFLAVRNRFSPLGFILFHGSFLLCLAGGLMIGYTRYSGKVGVAEGEQIKGRLDQLGSAGKRPLILRDLPELALKVNRIETRYEEGVPTDLEVDLDAILAGVTRHGRIRINEPLDIGAVTIVPQNVGLAPLVVVTSPKGEMIDSLYVRLNVLKGRSDSFTLGTSNQYRVRVTYFPEYAVYNGVETTRGAEPKNPAFHLVISSKDTNIYDGTILLGQSANMDGFNVSFRELHYWVNFQIIREYGQWPLIAGFVLGTLGLVLRLIFYQKRIQLVMENCGSGSTVYLQGQTEYFVYSFASEMEYIVGRLEEQLNPGGIDG